MVDEKGKIDLPKCHLEADGNVVCKVPKSTFDSIQKSGTKPKRLLLEIEG